MRYELKNECLTLGVEDAGAELRSLRHSRDGREMMFGADPAYWNRTSPVLFPFVGGTKEKTYYYQGKKYAARQHGFARDMVFTPASQTADALWFTLRDTQETRENYPFSFRLSLGYLLKGNTVELRWRVDNTGEDTMYFSIGGHPAFCCDLTTHGLIFEKDGRPLESLTSAILELNGSNCLSDRTKSFRLQEGFLPLTPEMFDEDALILENKQADAVTLTDGDKKPLLTVRFDAPLFGVWSPTGKNAPFVCIEPWYGRCDSADFSQKLEEKAYSTALPAGATFDAGYSITVHD